MKKLDKKKMVNLLYNRLNGTIPKKSIDDAIIFICDFLIKKVIDNESVSINNFGTFSPFIFHAHRAFNIAKGTIQQVKAFRSVKFRAHHTFLNFVLKKRDRFKA